MVTTVVGRIFLDAYNEKYGLKYDAKEFFANEYYPLFFGSKKYLTWHQNSPFVQRFKADKWTEAEGKERLNTFFKKIEGGARDASVALGYPASEDKEFATTSGQVTTMETKPDAEEAYLSWIGSSLAIGVAGGLCILLYEKRILLAIQQGWQYYRHAINNNDKMKGNQITTWNGQWLYHRYSREYVETDPWASFDPYETTGSEVKIKMQTWTRVMFGVSQKFDDVRLMGYIYSFGQMNKTIGFVPFLLDEVRRPASFYKKLFGMEGNKAESLYGGERGLTACCREGVLGLRAMEPKGMEKYIKESRIPSYNKNNEEKLLEFTTYQIWLIAMLNNQDLWDKSQEFAKTLHDYEVSDDRKLTTKRSNNVKAILESNNKKSFIAALTDVVSETKEKVSVVEMAGIVNAMPTDNVPYFLTLLRFHYAAIK